MRKWFCIQGKDWGIYGLVAAVLFTIALCFTSPASAIDTELGGKRLSFQGIIKQGVAYGITEDQYDTKKGIQSLLTQIILETKYDPHPDISLFVSGKFNADQAYPVFSNNDEWQAKGFDKSRDRLYVLDNWQDVLGEAHVTVKKGDFYVRAGKQIVGWGETDGFRLMDQINPTDARRGITDVEYENSIVPIFLLRTEYRPPTRPDWLQDLNFQFVFNPNAQFRGNQGPVPGNDTAGIWAPRVDIPLGGPYPADYAHLGSLASNIEKPGNFSQDGFAYAGRITANLFDARVSLNGYYGRSFDAVTTNVAAPPGMATSAWDNRMIMSPAVEGYYPLFKFVGATFTRDITPLKASFLGGVSPVLRLETFYAFKSTFTTNSNTFETFDETRAAVGLDWKVKIPLLNDKSGFALSGQVYDQRIMDYPTGGLVGVDENNWKTTLSISTAYFNAKLQPSVFWLRDYTNKSEFFRYQLVWSHSDAWKYTLGVLNVKWNKEGVGFEPLKDKDHIYFNVAYKF
ncbi:MAG: hypothetical protein NT140_08775 [Deltaproteobacteria bacterium]|nr:hypothetical protein [Deltaproteobacteria bacterium]